MFSLLTHGIFDNTMQYYGTVYIWEFNPQCTFCLLALRNCSVQNANKVHQLSLSVQ